MGTPKALLPIGSDTFVTRGAGRCSPPGSTTWWLWPAEHAAVADAVGSAGLPARIVREPPQGRGPALLAPDRAGSGRRPGVVAVLVHLVRCAARQARTARAVLDAFRARRRRWFGRTLDGRHGHPVLFSRGSSDDLRRADPADRREDGRAGARRRGLRTCRRRTRERCRDIDTPRGLTRALAGGIGRDPAASN